MATSIRAMSVSVAVLAVLGSPAKALPPSNWDDGLPVFYAAGDIDSAPAVYVAVTQLLLSSSIDVYSDNSGLDDRHPRSLHYLIISGRLARAIGSLPANSEIGFMYAYDRNLAASGIFAQGTPNGTPIFYPTLDSLASTSAPTGPALNQGPYPSLMNPTFNATGAAPSALNPQIPAWGITNLDLRTLNTPFNLNGVKQPFTLTGHSQPLYVVPYGVAVTASLYNFKKIWSKAEVAAVLSGSVLSWSQFNGDNGSPLPVSLGPVTLIDRFSGTSIKAAGSSYFLNYPGGTSSLGGALVPNSVAVPGVLAFPNSGYTGTTFNSLFSSKTEIQDLAEPSSIAETVDLASADFAGKGALAILTLDYAPATHQLNKQGANDYFFVAIDGVYPDSESGDDNINAASGDPRVAPNGSTRFSNIVQGRYDFAYTAWFNYRVSSTAGLGDFHVAVFNNLASENISGAHDSQGFPLAVEGILFDPTITNRTDAGNLNWKRVGASNAPPMFIEPVAPAGAQPFFMP